MNIAVADIDNDNQNDAIFSYLGDSICWYKNNNLGFTKMPSIYIAGINTITHFDIADIDGNGFKDIVVSIKSNTTINNKILLYKYNGTSWVENLIDNNIVQTIARSFFIDIDNDGDLDIVSCNDLNVVKYLNNGSGIFSPRNTIVGNSNEYYNMVVKDFDGNGFKDSIVHTANGTELFKANNTNTGYTKTTLATPIQTVLETVDMENDGDFDLFYPNQQNSTFMESYKNDGTGAFRLAQSISLSLNNQPNLGLKF